MKTYKTFSESRKRFQKKLGLRNSVIFEKEQREALQNQTKSKKSLYCQEISKKATIYQKSYA